MEDSLRELSEQLNSGNNSGFEASLSASYANNECQEMSESHMFSNENELMFDSSQHFLHTFVSNQTPEEDAEEEEGGEGEEDGEEHVFGGQQQQQQTLMDTNEGHVENAGQQQQQEEQVVAAAAEHVTEDQEMTTDDVMPAVGQSEAAVDPLMTTTVVKSESQEGEEEAQEDQFSVEAIVGKRKRNNRWEYCVKWLGFESDQNTWEPIDNLNCAELIADFESKQVTKTPAKRGRKPAATATATRRQSAEVTNTKKDGFARGLKPKRVVGVTEESGQLFYTIEFTGQKEAELVSGKVAKVKCPQLVIAFLQSKLTFNRKLPRQPLENYRPIQSKKFSLFNKTSNESND